MSSKKKESEGIALLSMYNDEDEDMEDVYKDQDDDLDDNTEELEQTHTFISDSGNEPSSPSQHQPQTPLPPEDSSSPKRERVPTPTPTPTSPPQFWSSSPLQQLLPPPSLPPPLLDSQRPRKQALTIVDYAHDENAMSPEAEEGEITSTEHVISGEDLQITNGNSQEKIHGTVHILTPKPEATMVQPSEQAELSESDNSTPMHYSNMESETADIEEAVMVSVEIEEDENPLERFLSPPPKTKCSEKLQEKINRFLDLKKKGRSFNVEVRNKKDYRNPDFLLHAVRFQGIDQIGSCFSKDVFDPHGYAKSDFYEEIEADLKREMERKEQEKKKSQKVEFVAGGTQPGMLTMASKIGMIPAVPTVAATGHTSISTTADAIARDGRQSKKSKWDKVDSDRKTSLHPGSQDSISTSVTHAALLSANAGSGYTVFAQQKRKEAEQRKSSEKRRS